MKLHLDSTRASAARKLLTAFLAVQTVALNFSPAWAAGNALPNPRTEGAVLSQDATSMVLRGGGTIEHYSFDIAGGNTVWFADDANTVTVNKVDPGNPSTIFGSLFANGKIYLLNPDGILFGSGSSVNVGGLVASTMTDVEKTAEGWRFGDPHSGDITVDAGAVINAGAFAYLVGRSVNVAGAVNAGDTVFAAYGNAADNTITLTTSSGGTITLDLGESWAPAEGSGSVTITNGVLSTGDAAATNAIYLYVVGDVTNTLQIAHSNVEAQAVTLYASSDISQIGSWQASAPAVTLRADGSTGIKLDNSANKFGGAVAATADNGAITLRATDTLTLGQVSTGGKLDASAGKITGSDIWKADSAVLKATGTSIELTGAADIAGATDVNAAGAIELTNDENIFDGAVTGTAGNGHLWLNGNFGDSVDVTSQKDRVSLGVNSGSGPVKASAPEWQVEIWGTSTNDTLRVAGVTADDYVRIYGKGQANVEGEVKANGLIIMDPVALVLDAPVTSVSSNVNLQAIDIKSTANGTITAGDEAYIGHAHTTNVVLQGGVFATNLVHMNGRVIALDGAIETGGDLVIITGTEGEARPGIIQGSTGSVKVGGKTYLASSEGDILFASEQNDFGTLVTAHGSSTDGTVTLVAANGINLDRVRASNLTVTAKSGDITQAADEKVIATGTSTLTATGDITLTNVANNFGGAVATTGKAVALTDNDGILLGNVDAAQLTVTAKGGDIDQASGSELKVTGTTDLTSEGGIIRVANSENDFGGKVNATALATNGLIRLNDVNDLTVGDVQTGYEAVLRANTNLTLVGTVSATNRVFLETQRGDVTGTETASITSGNKVEVYTHNATNSNIVLPTTTVGTPEKGELYVNLVSETGSITQVGAIKVLATNQTSYTTIIEGPRGASINLTNAENEFAGLSKFEGGSVDVKSASDLYVGSAKASAGDVALDAGGKLVVAERPSVTVEGGNVTLKSGAGKDIDLQDSVTATENLAMTAGGSIRQGTGSAVTVTGNTGLDASGDILLDGSLGADGDLGASAGGKIVQGGTGTVTVGGTTALAAESGEIKLANEGNDFDGKVIAASGADVTLVDADTLLLGPVAAMGNLSATALDGDLTVDGAMAAFGDLDLEASQGNLSVTTDGSVLAGKNAKLDALGNMAFDGSVQSGGTLTATAGGDFESTASGTITAGTDAILSSGGGMTVAGAVSAGSNVTATAGGDFKNTGTGTITASTGDVVVTATKNATVDAAVEATAGSVNATASEGSFESTAAGTITAGTNAVLYAMGNMTLAGAVAATNNVEATTFGTFENTGAGTISAGTNVVLYALGDMTLDGAVSAGSMVDAQAVSGDFKNTAAVQGGEDVLLSAAYNMDVQNTVKSETGSVQLDAGLGNVTVDSAVTAGQDLTMESFGGDILLHDAVSATNNVTAMAGGNFENTGYGEVRSGNKVELLAQGDSTINATVYSGTGSIWVASTNGKVDINGLLVAGSHLTVDAAGDIGVNTNICAGEDLSANAEFGSIKLADGIDVQAGEDLVLKANQDLSLTTATIQGLNVGLEATNGSLTDDNATLLADGMMVLVAGDTVTLNGGVKSSSLGMLTGGDIVLEDLTANQFAATSTGGNVKITTQSALELANMSAGVEADRADGGKDTVSGGDLNGIQATVGDVTLTGQDLGGTQISAGGTATIDAAAYTVDSTTADGNVTLNTSSVNSGTISSRGGSVNAKVSGGMSVGTLSAGRDIVLDSVGGEFRATTVSARNDANMTIRGGATVQDLTAGNQVVASIGGPATVQDLKAGKLDANIGGSATLRRVNVGGSADIKTGGSLTFDQMKASTVKTKSGTLNAGKLDASRADIDASSIRDNGSLLRTGTLNMHASGDIGSAGRPINLDTRSRIDRIGGNNVYLVEQTSGHNVTVGVIDARGHLSLTAPRIGLPDGVYGFVDGNGDAVNLRAGNGLELDIAGFFGQPRDPMEAEINGSWSLRSGSLHGMSNGDPSTGTPLNLIYMVFGNTLYTDTPEYAGDGPIPGLVIVNGRPVQGHPDLLRKIHSALAFTADTPELKSTQGVFGNPLFLHTDIALTDMGALGRVDYLTFMQLSLQRPDLSVLRDTLTGGEQYLLEQWGADTLFPKKDQKTLRNQPAILRIEHKSAPAKPKPEAARAKPAQETPAKADQAKDQAK